MRNKSKHILWVTNWYPNEFHNTLGNFVQRHAEAASIYNKITVLAPIAGIKWQIDITQKNALTEVRTYYPKWMRFVGAWVAFKRGLSKVDAPIDVVHGHALIGCWWMLLYFGKKTKTLLTEHWAGFHNLDERRLSWIKRLGMKRAGRQLYMAIPVTEQLGETMKNLSYINSYRVVANVVDTDLFKPKPKPTSNSFCQFIHVSTLDDAQKNIRGLIEVAKLLSDENKSFHLEIIGDGATTPWIDLANGKNIYPNLVSIEGEKPLEAIAMRMQNADALVLFSRYENFPCVIAEAMACGIPVISTNVGGISEHINEKNGILLPTEDKKALKEAMKSLINTHNQYDAEAIRQYAEEHFSYASVGKKFDDLYSEVILR